jgi:hypothetical protein
VRKFLARLFRDRVAEQLAAHDRETALIRAMTETERKREAA